MKRRRHDTRGQSLSSSDAGEVTCILCGGSGVSSLRKVTDYWYTRESFTLYSCPSCGVAFIHPASVSGPLSRYYEPAYYAHSAAHLAFGRRERAQLDSLRLQKGEKLSLRQTVRTEILRRIVLVDLPFIPDGRLLDVGCGAGNLIAVAEQVGFECYGVEPSERARSLLAECGRRAYSDLNDIELPQSDFDIVVFSQSLEHMPEPMRSLEKAVALLRSGGTLIVSAPNYACTESSCFGEYWRHLDVPRHLLGLTPSSLRWIAAQLQLDVRLTKYKPFSNPRSSYQVMRREAGEAAANRARCKYVGLQAAHLASGQREKFGSMMSFYMVKA